MKHTKIIILALATTLLISCNKEKAAIDDRNDAVKEEINARKVEVDDAAKMATKQTETNATIDNAEIEATKVANQAQLDAEIKKADAAAKAAKARVDAENK